jgi:hypothetical protein
LSISFRPSAAGGARVDDAVRQRAADSFALLRDPIAAERAEFRAPLDRCIASLRAGPVRPALFALYADLVQAISSDDETAFLSAMRAIAEFDVEAPDEIRAVTITEDDLGRGMPDRFVGHLDDDPTSPLRVGPVSADALSRAQQGLGETCALLDAAAPELGGEIRALIHEVVFLGAAPDSDGLSFHGASSFYLWGALFLNAAAHPDRATMAEGLAHEAAHCLLLGHTLGAPLVENDESERFISPLREDPRPMDGIVHATYVLARMHYCIERLLASSVLIAEERERLQAAKLRRRAEYAQGLEVVRSHARFTPVGRALFAGAQTYMSERIAA